MVYRKRVFKANRPRIPKEDRRTIRIQVVISPNERKICEAIARERKMTLSEVMRTSLLPKATRRRATKSVVKGPTNE